MVCWTCSYLGATKEGGDRRSCWKRWPVSRLRRREQEELGQVQHTPKSWAAYLGACRESGTVASLLGADAVLALGALGEADGRKEGGSDGDEYLASRMQGTYRGAIKSPPSPTIHYLAHVAGARAVGRAGHAGLRAAELGDGGAAGGPDIQLCSCVCTVLDRSVSLTSQ